MWNVFDVVVFVAGFAACWFGKDWIIKTATGAESFARSLEAKAKAVRAAL